MTFNELYSEAYNQDLNHEPQKFIDFFEQNRILIEGQKIEKNNEIYDKVTRLNCDYAHSLTLRENYTNALKIIDRAINLLEKHPDYKEIDLFEVPYYEALVFDRASVNYYLKKIKEAEKDLIELTKRFPGNDKYRNWKNATKVYELNRTEIFLYYLVAAAVLSNIFLDESYGFFWRLRITLLIAGLVGIAVTQLTKWILRKKWSKNSTQTIKL